ncbi:peptide-methionine (R)-S-oxide reductase MsrB [Terrimonas pollutisoli]|uniref:peptide-methionine (R)-S-oxide reductase MsrB n=1 Tax=Terrimonas pollutisoli TaxID=3034147 RepID=UPI0023EA7D59|nr:peptide-methionine (R)-S-oxide reductase MsrB [Terrimonas sp. H1YJ31]
MRLPKLIMIVLLASLLQQCSYSQSNTNSSNSKQQSMDISKKHPLYSNTDTSKVNVPDSEWEKVLPKEVFNIARLKGTERPWSSPYESLSEKGTYYCAVCGNALFKSDTKFESGCGWPSFYDPISKGSIIYTPDNSHGMQRTEVQCGRCKSHLGHVFDDGPPPTGLRYCINGVVLDFAKAKEAEKKYNEKPAQD